MSVDVQVPLEGPQELVPVAGGGDDLEADVAEGVQDDDAAALEPDAVRGVPTLLLFHSFRKFALKEKVMNDRLTISIEGATTFSIMALSIKNLL